MTDLSKQQLILLALLVSFVTSLATGIITVSLMDQAPQGVTRTITQVIQKTIQEAVPQDAAVVLAPSFQDQAAAAVQTVTPSTVKIRSRASDEFAGLGLVVNAKGIIVTDKSTVAQIADYVAVLSDGTTVPVAIVQAQIDGDIVFLAPSVPSSRPITFAPASFASSTMLGETIFSLYGTTTARLAQGVITQQPSGRTGTSTDALVLTSIPGAKAVSGSPLFDLQGNIVGIRTSSLPTGDGTSFYPIQQIQSVVPNL